MPAPTFEQLMAASRTQLMLWFESADQQTSEAAETHIEYRDNLISFANDILDQAENGIGSNPPGNPPPPPGA